MLHNKYNIKEINMKTKNSILMKNVVYYLYIKEINIYTYEECMY